MLNISIAQSAEVHEGFQQMAEAVGGIYSESNHQADEILKGDFRHQNYFGGLSTHVSNVIELKSVNHLVELPACVSFNILFEGQVDIALADQRYQLGPVKAGAAECSAIVAPQPEVLTRQLKQDMKVSKLNVFVERAWLEARSHSQKGSALINKIFGGGALFTSWEASEESVQLARKLIKQERKCVTLYDKIRLEQLTIQLLLDCLSGLEKSMSHYADKGELAIQHDVLKRPALKQKIDALIPSHSRLVELANAMNMSVSTLQRKFKNQYGITVSDYSQKKRLEMAKKAIFVEGVSIGEAAYQAGYKHNSNFIAAFKKRFQSTPAAMLAKHKGK